MTLEERVREKIIAYGPQHESEWDETNYINDRLERMPSGDLLRLISDVFEDLGLT